MNFENFYSKYSGKSGFMTVEISGEMIKIMGSGSSQVKGGSISEILDGIKYIRIVVAEEPSSSFGSDMDRLAEDKSYKLMSSMNDSGQKITFYFKDAGSGSSQSDFMMLVKGTGENIAISISGDIDITKISKLSGLGIGGLDKLDAME